MLDSDPKAMQQIKFTENLAWDGSVDTTMFFHYWKRNNFRFSQGTMRVSKIYFTLI